MSAQEDSIDLNVPGLMGRYSNPSSTWRNIVRALATTQMKLFRQYGLIKESAPALLVCIEEAVVGFSDYTAAGQAFVKSGEVDKWLRSCDRKGNLPLERRIVRFLQAQPAVPADRRERRRSR